MQNAVSECLISRATDCIHASVVGSVSTQIAAGFPAKAVCVNASTIVMR